MKLAPTGPAAALHLCAPVILLAVALVNGQRRLGAREVATLALMIAGALAAALSVPAGSHATHPLLGLTLALASSAAFAAMISMIFMRAPTMSLPYCNAIKGLAGGALLMPLVIAHPPTLTAAAIVVGSAPSSLPPAWPWPGMRWRVWSRAPSPPSTSPKRP